MGVLSVDLLDRLGELAEDQPFLGEFFEGVAELSDGTVELSEELLAPVVTGLETLAATSDDYRSLSDEFIDALNAEDTVPSYDDMELHAADDAYSRWGNNYAMAGVAPQIYFPRTRKNADAIYGIWFQGRRTAVVVSADNRSSAISKARKRKKRGGESVTKARVLNASESKTARSGRWVRSGPNGEPAGYNKNKRGKGPAPKKT